MSESQRDARPNGPVAALMDELERAAGELSRIVEALSDDEFEAVCNPGTENEMFRSLQTIVHHVVRAGYAHANHVRVGLAVPWSRIEVPLGTRAESLEQLPAMLAYAAATLDGRWGMTEEEIEAVRIEARWGPVFNLEQMLEHMIVHVLRHRRQIERLLARGHSDAA